MARHGENIRKRKDGRWEGRYPVYNEEKGRQVYCSVYGRTYGEVKEKQAAQKNLLKNPIKKAFGEAASKKQMPPSDITLADAAQSWLAGIKEKRKLSTYVKYSLIYRNHIEKIFECAAVSEITDAYVEEKISDHLSGSVKKSIYCVLNQILKSASMQYSITLPGLERPASDVKNKPVKVLSKQEQSKLIAVLHKDMDIFKLAVLLCLFTGLRLGELCALKWADIDLDNKILTVNRTVQRLYVEGSGTKTTLIETEPKSEYSHRQIPLSAAILKLLLKFRSDREYVFGGDTPLEPRTMQYQYKKILGEAKLPNTNFHILRHTFSTNCIDGGTDVKSLSEMLGHSDVQITLNRYVHPSMDTKRKHMEALSNYYGRIHGRAS